MFLTDEKDILNAMNKEIEESSPDTRNWLMEAFNVSEQSIEVKNIALLTERIKQHTERYKQFKKYKTSQRGLLILIGKRRRLLKNIQRTNIEEYRKVIKELGLHK
jgi:ribosomal protein S15